MKRPLTLFVSSTCYDLAPIRRDIKRLYESVGIRVLLSEENDFPVLPGKDNFSQCFANVSGSDIFVIVIGKRAGYVMENGKTIVNNELDVAVRHKMPIYAFIDNSLKALFSVYKANKGKEIEIPGIDNVRLLDFALSIFENSKIWSYGFSTFDDIQSVLKSQIPILLYDSLAMRKAVQGNGDIESIGLSPESLQIVYNKSKLWEHELFNQLIKEEIKSCDSLRSEIESDISLDYLAYHFGDDAHRWILGHLGKIQKIINPLSKIMDTKKMEEAFGPKGIPGNPGKIAFIARSLGKVYRSALVWALQVKGVVLDDEYTDALETLAMFEKSISISFQSFSAEFEDVLSRAKEHIESGDNSPLNLDVCWTINLDDEIVHRFQDNLKKASADIAKRMA